MGFNVLFFACFILFSQQAVKPASKKENENISKKMSDRIHSDASKIGMSAEEYRRIYLKNNTQNNSSRSQIENYNISVFRKGYQNGIDKLYYSALSEMEKIPKNSTLYPQAKKLMSLYKKRINAWTIEHDNRIKYTNSKPSSYTHCVDPKYGCHGSENCHKCTDCSRCRHCNDHNGSCGVCR